MEARGRARHEMSLAALRHTDPYINTIVDVTGQVALYSFSPRTGEWEKTDIEGTLFVYTRSASPHHGFTIMNRLNMNNLVEPVNKDLEFQLHEPFLLYRNASLSIYSIWFYDKNDCKRIAKLMTDVVSLESERVRARTSPLVTNGGADQPIDILEMLSKAKNEYEKGHVVNDQTTTSGVQKNVRMIKADPVETSEPPSSSQDKSFHAVQKHLTVEELFGTSLSKEQTASFHLNSETSELLPEKAARSAYLPFSSDQSKLLQPLTMKSEPAEFSSSSNECAHPAFNPVLIPQIPVSQPDCQRIQTFPIRLSPSLCSAPASDVLTKSTSLSSSNTTCIRHVMQNTGRQLSPLMSQPLSDFSNSTSNPPILPPCIPVSLGKVSSTTPSDVELLQKLKLTSQVDQIQPQPVSKACIAPKFSCAASQLATPESFKGNSMKAMNSIGIAPVQASQFVTPATTAASSVLLSPSVFEQSVQKSAKSEDKARMSPPMQVTTDLPMFALSRSQLQETLVHLIKNDSSFLNTVHEVYLQSLTKTSDKVKL
ncbi:mRNA-decapping enzyme 1A [Pelobates fuscus]|uniref:mRNA-decapping enzyme 1A n=1 Tax=Pelobates fuscus TaxID=191477 RepID=UPI002FE42FBA